VRGTLALRENERDRRVIKGLGGRKFRHLKDLFLVFPVVKEFWTPLGTWTATNLPSPQFSQFWRILQDFKRRLVLPQPQTSLPPSSPSSGEFYKILGAAWYSHSHKTSLPPSSPSSGGFYKISNAAWYSHSYKPAFPPVLPVLFHLPPSFM